LVVFQLIIPQARPKLKKRFFILFLNAYIFNNDFKGFLLLDFEQNIYDWPTEARRCPKKV